MTPFWVSLISGAITEAIAFWRIYHPKPEKPRSWRRATLILGTMGLVALAGSAWFALVAQP